MKHDETIGIYFSDVDICTLFRDLISGKGYKTEIIHDVRQLEHTTKVITEPLNFPDLLPSQQDQCLVVKNTDDELHSGSLTVSQPLTIPKINKALAEFLS